MGNSERCERQTQRCIIRPIIRDVERQDTSTVESRHLIDRHSRRAERADRRSIKFDVSSRESDPEYLGGEGDDRRRGTGGGDHAFHGVDQYDRNPIYAEGERIFFLIVESTLVYRVMQTQLVNGDVAGPRKAAVLDTVFDIVIPFLSARMRVLDYPYSLVR